MATQVNANPTKELFISMLTRDIDIRAAILELIDNSIDGAKRLRPNGDFSDLYIDITFDAEHFTIKDNCGGMGIDIAKEYAFRFGRPSKRLQETSMQQFTGIFGIVMKRSLFRLGNFFSVSSTTQKESFLLNVDVEKWVQDDDTNWTFTLDDEKNNLNNPIENTGTTIEIQKLHDGIKKQFGLSFFENSLISYIEKFKTLAIENGLTIRINDKNVVFTSESIIVSSDVHPYTFSITQDSVTIKIIAGIAPKGNPEKAGWYVYCNGRLVVFADKTSLTGWGESDVRQYHPSLAFFRGFVFFESYDLEQLPWNTTKTNVDASSEYYIFAKTKMRDATLQITKDCSAIMDNEIPEDKQATLFSKSNLTYLNSTSIVRLTEKQTPFTLNVTEIKYKEPMSNISFQKPTSQVDIVKRKLSAKTNKDLGVKVFDYYFKRECVDDE